jgi:hypothetical protein
MSTVISASSVQTPPTPPEGKLADEHAASAFELARTRLVNRVGFWTATLTATLALGWVVAVALGRAGLPTGKWGLVTQFAPSLLLPLAYVTLMVAIRESMPTERRTWPSIAVPFATIYAALNVAVYFVQLTLVLPSQLNGRGLGDLAPFEMRTGAYLYALDVLGYLMMSLAAAVVAFTFARSQSRLERWIYWLLLANWALVLLGPPVMMFWSQAVSLMLLWAAIWTITIPVPMILLAVLFHRERRVALSEAGRERSV